MLYVINNIITFAACIYMLTPRINRVRAVLLLTLVFVPSMVIKFAVPVDSLINIILAFFNWFLIISYLYSICRETLAECVLVLCCVIISSMFASIGCDVLGISVYAETEEISATLGYMLSMPVLALCSFILVRGKRYLNSRVYRMPGLKMTVLLVVSLVHCIIMEFVVAQNMSSNIARINLNIILVLFAVLLIMIYKKGEEHHQLEYYSELKKRQQEAERHYELLLKKTEMMHRIRHDFYGQLTTARYIISQDREKGLQMIKELNERLSKAD